MAQKTITMKAWIKLTRKDTSPNNRATNGPSPGGVAAELGITRQAVHQAIERGDLDAWRIVDDSTGRLRAIVIPYEAVLRYKEIRAIQGRRNGVQLHLLHGA
jgi:hypothetical protein